MAGGTDTAPIDPRRRDASLVGLGLLVAGLLGIAAVTAASLAAHGPLAEAPVARGWLQAIAFVAGVHAPSLIALATVIARPTDGPPGLLLRGAMLLLGLGALLFVSALAAGLIGLAGAVALAPFGGGAMIIGWLACAAAGLAAVFRA